MAFSGDFELWASRLGGVRIVDSAVRREVLRALASGPRSLSDLAEHTQKAKSTLSAIHMPDLIQAGLVVERRHPADSRVVLYELSGRSLTSGVAHEGGVAEAYEQEARLRHQEAFRRPWDLVDPASIGRHTPSRKIVDHLARQVARAWAPSLRATRFPDLLIEIGEALSDAGILTMTDISPMGHQFRITGLGTKAEGEFFRVALTALIADKAGLRARVRAEDRRGLTRVEFVDP